MIQVQQQSFEAVIKHGSFHGKGFTLVKQFADKLVVLDTIEGMGANTYPMYFYYIVKPEGRFARFRKPVIMQACEEVYFTKQEAFREFNKYVTGRLAAGYTLVS
jgi:hypothetical protein